MVTFNSTILRAAHAYARKGWPVLPIVPDDKTPLTEHGFKDASTDKGQIDTWWTRWPEANVGLDCGRAGVIVIDVDPRNGGEETWKALVGEMGAEIERTLRVLTPGGGSHFYYQVDGQQVRNGNLGKGVDVRGAGGYVLLPPSQRPEGRYVFPKTPKGTRTEIALLPEVLVKKLTEAPRPRADHPDGPRIPEGVRNETLFRLGCFMRGKGFVLEAIEAALLAQNTACCEIPLDEAEVRRSAQSTGRYPAGPLALASWPVLPLEALYGLAGDVVRAIAPHTEADPAALLLQFLVAFGNAVGRGPCFQVESTAHHLNEYVVLVGNTSRARKGTSSGHILRLFESAAPDWAKYRVQGGLSTGEGLVHAVRDERWERDKDGKEYLADAGVTDKRLLALESEFSRPLRVAKREGNILAELIRQGWDTGKLQILTKTTPAKAAGAHISIIGHITQEELQRRLSDTDAFSGFANRFLWGYVRRSKVLPHGGSLSDADLAPLKTRLAEAITFASRSGGLARDDKTYDLWDMIYHPLTAETPGLFGAVTSRAEAHAVRLSALYAVLDQSAVIRLPHLLAALAVWQYCEASAAAIFGRALGDKTADRILAALRERPNEGMTRTEIRDYFQRNKPEEEIARALTLLGETGRAEAKPEQTDGRPAERWVATPPSVVSVVRSYIEISKAFIRAKGWDLPPAPPTPPAPDGKDGSAYYDLTTETTEAPTSDKAEVVEEESRDTATGAGTPGTPAPGFEAPTILAKDGLDGDGEGLDTPLDPGELEALVNDDWSEDDGRALDPEELAAFLEPETGKADPAVQKMWEEWEHSLVEKSSGSSRDAAPPTFLEAVLQVYGSEDVLFPHEIARKLGAPWTPWHVRQAFAQRGIPAEKLQFGHVQYRKDTIERILAQTAEEKKS